MITKQEWNEIINNLLLQVKPIKLRLKIGEKILNLMEENALLKEIIKRVKEKLKDNV